MPNGNGQAETSSEESINEITTAFQSPEPVGGSPFANLSPQEAESILRNLALSTIPVQEARLGAAISQLLPQIQGSPAEVRSVVTPQIQQIRNNLERTFDVISQRLGRFAGGQAQRERGRALGEAGTQLQNVFARQPAIALQQLLQTLGAFSPTLSVQPPLQTTTQDAPINFAQIGQGIFDIGAVAQNLFASAPFSSPPLTTAASGTNPFTGDLLLGSTGILGGRV